MFSLSTVGSLYPSTVFGYNSHFLLIGAFILALSYAAVGWYSNNKLYEFKGQHYPLFPGPKGYPFVGNLPQLSAKSEGQLTTWANRYGPIYRLRLGVYDCLVLTSPTVVRDLLVERGSNYSDRLPFEVLGRVMLQLGGIGATPYNDDWRLHRKMANTFLAPRALDKFNHVIDEEGVNFVKAVWKEYKSRKGIIAPIPHCARFPMNSMLYILYGWRTQGIDDPIVKKGMELGECFAAITGILENTVDFLPILRFIPNKNVKTAAELHQDFIRTWGGLIKRNEELMEKGEGAPDSLSAVLSKAHKDGEISWTQACMFATGIMLAGIETTAGTMAWLIAILSLRPDLQAKAHAQLDAEVGPDRLPDFSDEARLPYIKALLKETLRFRNPFPQGIPHMSVNDDVYRGCFIPKRTILMMNVYGIHFDPQRYPDPEKFDPDRFDNDSLTSTESANLSDPLKRDHWAFGAGRRICVGMSLADREMFLAISRLLWAFKIESVPGKEVDVNNYSGELPRTPADYDVKLIPRHKSVSQILDDI